MKKNLSLSTSSSYSPLDIATAFYVIVSGIYLCFGISGLEDILPHFATRIGLLILIVVIVYCNKKYPGKYMGLLRSTYPVLLLSFFYTETGYLKNIIFHHNLDDYFVHAEQWLWGFQPSLKFSEWMPQKWFNEFMNICYFSYYPLILGICVIFYFDNKPYSHKSIFTIVFSFYLYYLFYDLVPVVGPQFHFNTLYTDEAPPYYVGKFMRYILKNLEKPTGAFPSSHVGIALIVSVISFKHLRKYFYYSLLFVFGICFATVYLKAHYLVDVIGAIVTVPILMMISSYVYDKLWQHLVPKP